MEKVCFRYYRDMGFTFSLLGSKDTLFCVNDASMNYVTNRLHSGMCESKLRVYIES